MTRQMTATELKATILSVLDEVAGGEVVEISKRGRTIARLVPAGGSSTLKGRYTGVAASAASDDDLFSAGEAWDIEQR